MVDEPVLNRSGIVSKLTGIPYKIPARVYAKKLLRRCGGYSIGQKKEPMKIKHLPDDPSKQIRHAM